MITDFYYFSAKVMLNERGFNVTETMKSFEYKWWALYASLFDKLKKSKDPDKEYERLRKRVRGEELQALNYFYDRYVKDGAVILEGLTQLDEGIRWDEQSNTFIFDWNTDRPDDIMSLKFSPWRGRKGTMFDTTYYYYYSYRLDKNDWSSEVMRAIKYLDERIHYNDAKMLVNKAVMGLDREFRASTFDTIISPASSSIILNELTQQLYKKSGASNLFTDAFVKAASTDIRYDEEKVNELPERTRNDFMRAFNKIAQSGEEFKVKDIRSRYRKFLRDFLIFNSQEDARLYNAVEGKKVLLVDDYRTSGTSLKEMIRKLAESGADRVIAFILIKLGDG